MKTTSLHFILLAVLFTYSGSLHAQGRRTTGGANITASILSVTPSTMSSGRLILTQGRSYDFEIEATDDFTSDFRDFFLAPDVQPFSTEVNIIGSTGSVNANGRHHILVNNLSLSPGNYQLKLCMSSLFFVIFDGMPISVAANVGVTNVNGESDINIFPNPATNLLNVSMDEIIRCVTIRDAMGHEVYAQEGSAETMKADISNLPSGNYYVTMKGNTKVVTRHFVKP